MTERDIDKGSQYQKGIGRGGDVALMFPMCLHLSVSLVKTIVAEGMAGIYKGFIPQVLSMGTDEEQFLLCDAHVHFLRLRMSFYISY